MLVPNVAALSLITRLLKNSLLIYATLCLSCLALISLASYASPEFGESEFALALTILALWYPIWIALVLAPEFTAKQLYPKQEGR
jgi:hypothetical protein